MHMPTGSNVDIKYISSAALQTCVSTCWPYLLFPHVVHDSLPALSLLLTFSSRCVDTLQTCVWLETACGALAQIFLAKIVFLRGQRDNVKHVQPPICRHHLVTVSPGTSPLDPDFNFDGQSPASCGAAEHSTPDTAPTASACIDSFVANMQCLSQA